MTKLGTVKSLITDFNFRLRADDNAHDLRNIFTNSFVSYSKLFATNTIKMNKSFIFKSKIS